MNLRMSRPIAEKGKENKARRAAQEQATERARKRGARGLGCVGRTSERASEEEMMNNDESILRRLASLHKGGEHCLLTAFHERLHIATSFNDSTVFSRSSPCYPPFFSLQSLGPSFCLFFPAQRPAPFALFKIRCSTLAGSFVLSLLLYAS